MSNIRIECPCCSRSLLRHIRSTGTYWYCPHCRQEMPIFSLLEPQQFHGKNQKQTKLKLGNV